MFADFKEAGLTNMIDGDNFIPEHNITKETAPGIASLRRAGVLEVDGNIPLEQIKADLLTTSSSFLLEIKTKDEMLEWVITNTNLEEVENWKFLISEANEMREVRYLIID